MKWDYISIETSEILRGKEIKIQILAQISEMYGFSKNSTIDTLPSIIKKQIEQNIVNIKLYGIAKVLGYMDEKKVIRMPRRNRLPGEEVYLAPENLLKEFFSKRQEEGLNIGSLITNPNVNVFMDPNGLNRHLSIIAQTGAGNPSADVRTLRPRLVLMSFFAADYSWNNIPEIPALQTRISDKTPRPGPVSSLQ